MGGDGAVGWVWGVMGETGGDEGVGYGSFGVMELWGGVGLGGFGGDWGVMKLWDMDHLG